MVGKFGGEFRSFRLASTRKIAREKNNIQEKRKLASSLSFHRGGLVVVAEAEARRTQGTEVEIV